MLKRLKAPIAATIVTIISGTGRSITLAANPRTPPAQWMACPQAPSLHCANGSICKEGIATFDPKHDHLNLQTHESGYYCECMDGFIGHECTIEVQDCENSIGYSPSDPTGVLMHSCYHGATCKSFAGGSMCDCNELNRNSAPDATKFAGLMCEHQSTTLCAVSLIGRSAPNDQFCTNHGTCKKEVAGGAPHPKCDCRDGWSGDHCEIRSDVFAKASAQYQKQQQQQQQQQGVSDLNVGGTVLFSFILAALIAVVIGIVVLLYSMVKKNRGPKEKAVGITAAEAGVGEIEMDGSSTLSPAVSNENGVVGSGDYENHDLKLEEEMDDGGFEDVAVSSPSSGGDGGEQTFTISDSHEDGEEDDAEESSDDEPAIV